MKKIITISKIQTQKLGELLAKEIHGACLPKRQGRVICLSGDLGAGKTTFTQGFLKGLKIKGPYTSPTFVILKNYPAITGPRQGGGKLKTKNYNLKNVYHIDAYRVNDKDLLNLGWKEMIADKNNIIIIEWAERIKNIIPKDSIWIKFKWLDENKRELAFS